MTAHARRIIVFVAGAVIVLGAMGAFVSWRLGGIRMPLAELGQGGAGLIAPGRTSVSGDALPVLAEAMPEFAGIQQWLNADPQTAAGLKGKVVLIDFWTYSCINCIRTLPFITAWHGKYADDGLVIVGVHTPEFAFEKSEANVRKALERHGIEYPVALDNDFGTWNAYGNRYWPAKYLFDAQGRLRYTHFGEGEYDETEHNIQTLLKEAGVEADDSLTQVRSDVDHRSVGTPETYVGYGREEYFASVQPLARDEERNYSIPEVLRMNTFALHGTWRVESERAVLADGEGVIANHFSAASANLVMGAPSEVRAEVLLDGAPVPAEKRGADVYEEGGRTWVRVSDERLYGLIDARGEYGTHVLRLRFETDGVRCYAYTFG